MSPTTVSAYLARINVTESVSNDLESLRLLQERHMLAVPFENFDVFQGKGASREVDRLIDKVIYRKRGGYCFELNTLYGELLKALGFTIKPVLARVLLRSPEVLPPRNHLVNLVEINDDWYLSDVGFGGLASRIPIVISSVVPVSDGDGILRVVPRKEKEFLIERKSSEGWQPQYQFQTVKAVPADIQVVNFFTYQHPDSMFVNHRLIGLFTPNGRIGLFDYKFSERQGVTVVEERELGGEEEWLKVVKERFGIAYPG